MKLFRKAMSVLLCVIITVFSAFATSGADVSEDPMSLPRVSAKASNSADAFTSLSYSHDSRFATDYEVIDVIDVSTHNGTIDWNKVYAAGIHEAIIRVGYRGSTKGGVYLDDMFETNYNGAIAAGLKVGVYFYTQAITLAEAEEEANFVINAIKGKNIALPVIYDCEYAEKGSGYTGRLYEANLLKISQTSICIEFLDTIEAAGYDAMLYANKYMLTDKIYASSIESSYPIWLACYKTSAEYTGAYEMWQYTPSGKVDGISGNVDLNFRYVKKTEIKKIEVSAAKTEITVGDTLQASATKNEAAISAIGTAGTITWTSSAPEIATVDANGLITAVSAGKVEITASVIVTPAQGTAQTFSDKISITVNAVQTDPTPDDPTPTDPVDDDPVDDTTVDDDDTVMQIINMITNFIVWLINLFGKLMAMMG